jgi:hypothetical protein
LKSQIVISSWLFFFGEMKQEVRRESGRIAANGLIEGSRLYSVQRCQVGIKHHLLTAYERG